MAFCSVSEMHGQMRGPRSSSTNCRTSWSGQSFEVGVVVAAPDDLATDLPEVAPVAIESCFGCLAAQ